MAVHMIDKLEKIIHLAWEENPLGVQKLRVGAVTVTADTYWELTKKKKKN